MRIVTLVCLFIFQCPLQATELEGVVTEVHDGDSVTLVAWNSTYHIRLADIDAPELKQQFGKDSRFTLRQICLLKKAVAETVGEDRYGRTLARLTCVGVDASAEQVRRGSAWVFRRYAPANSPLYALEQDARLARRGLWQDAAAVAPWEWRRNHRTTEAGADQRPGPTPRPSK
jgi:endonuclease YncB( thermonuclease family)